MLGVRAVETISQADMQGWSPLTSPSLALSSELVLPSLIETHSRALPSRLSVLRQLLPDALVERHLIGPLNDILRRARADHTIKAKERLTDLTLAQWWCFVARWLLESLVIQKNVTAQFDRLYARASKNFGDHRFSAVHKRLQFGTQQFLHLLDGFHQHIVEVIDIGGVVVIDDQLLSYFGQDMRNEGLAIKIPDKPHGYGLFSVAAAVKLPKSGLRVVVDLEVQEAGHKITAPSALLSIVKRLRARSPQPFVSVFDSAFVSKHSINTLRNWGEEFVASIKPTRAAQFTSILSLGSVDIPVDHSRSFTTEDLVLQISQRHGHQTAILSNAFSNLNSSPPDLENPINHSDAWNLYAAFSLPALLFFFPAARELNTNHKSLVAKFVTGIDPLLPPPGADGKQTQTYEYLQSLDAETLRDLAKRMGSSAVNRKMTKSELVTHIGLMARIAPSNSSTTPDTTRPEKYIENRLLIARGDISDSHTVTDFFGDHYGYIDSFNREFYSVFKTSRQNHYKTLLAFQLVTYAVLNSYAVYTERTSTTPAPLAEPGTKQGPSVKHDKCIDYVLSVVEDILNKFGTK
jgi:hypothetical protein